MTTVTASTIHGDSHVRVSLPTPHWTGRVEVGTGYWLDALYTGPRSGRHFAKFHSQWVGSYGTGYRELTEADYLRHCELAMCDPVGVDVEEV